MPGSIIKAEIRNRIWNLLTQQKVALFPGAFGRTPKFRGMHKAILRLRETPEWQQAQRVLVLGESVLGKVRTATIDESKTLVVPDLTRIDGWIGEVDPTLHGLKSTRRAIANFGRPGKSLPSGTAFQTGTATRPVDLMVIGAVCVDHFGARIGKGIGEADIVYALGRDRGFIGENTPVVVMVHHLQVIEERATREATDLPVDLIITPRAIRRVDLLGPRPRGIETAMITPDRIEAFPGLKDILEREGIPYVT